MSPLFSLKIVVPDTSIFAPAFKTVLAKYTNKKTFPTISANTVIISFTVDFLEGPR